MLTRVREKIRGYKTVVFNAVIGGSATVGMVLEQFEALDFSPLLGEYAAKILLVISVIGIMLRLSTNGPAMGPGSRRCKEPSGYEQLDEEDENDDADERPRRSSSKSRKARRKGRPTAG
jgi:hypothetical protein